MQEAVKQFPFKERVDFLVSYLQGDSEGYSEIIKKESQFLSDVLKGEFKAGSPGPYEPQIVDLIIGLSQLKSMDKICQALSAQQ